MSGTFDPLPEPERLRRLFDELVELSPSARERRLQAPAAGIPSGQPCWRCCGPSRRPRRCAASPAVDYAPPIPGDDRDVSGTPRDQDLPLRPNAEGVRDVGAFERLSIDPLVGSGAFVADFRPWEGVQPGTVAFDGTHSVNAGSGSARVSGAPINGLRLVGARQCVYLPGPGRYRLNGYGMTQFATTPHRDAVVLNWALHRDGSEQCDIGPIDASGDHLLTRGNAWFRPAQPAVIELPAEAWTPNSSLTVSLVMIDTGIAFPAQVQGWFDEITLEAQSLDNGVAADGFDDDR